MNDLFTLPEHKSPRLKWMEKHRIVTHYDNIDDGLPWMAFIRLPGDNGTVSQCFENALERHGDEYFFYGLKEYDSIVELCKKHGIKLWNEE